MSHFQQRGGGGETGGQMQQAITIINHQQQSSSSVAGSGRPRSSNLMTGQGGGSGMLLMHPEHLSDYRGGAVTRKEMQQAQIGNLAANPNLINGINSVASKLSSLGGVIDSDRSLESSMISASTLSIKQPFRQTLNIASSSTLRSGIGAILDKQKKQVQEKSSKQPAVQVLYQDKKLVDKALDPQVHNKGGFSIKGRKVDSPRLVVVKELREQEDQDEIDQFAGHGLIRKHDMTHDEIDANFSRIHRGSSHHAKSSHKTRPSRSVELLANKRKRSKERPAALGHGHVNQSVVVAKPPVQPKSKGEEKSNRNIKLMQSKSKQVEPTRVNHRSSSGKGTKSSRDLKTSMAFNDLLNQLDRDVKIQINQLQGDFKNRTANEILQADPAQQQQEKAFKPIDQLRQKSKSRSKDRQVNQSANPQIMNPTSRAQIVSNLQAILPQQLSIKGFNRNDRSRKKSSGSHNLTDITPDKSSFIKSEHDRCVTSQAVHSNNFSLNQIGRAQSSCHSGIPKPAKNQSKIGAQNELMNEHMNHGSCSNGGGKLKDQSSPDRGSTNNLGKQPHHIDQIVRMNIKKNLGKIEEERALRQLSEERLKKKKEIMDHNNNVVRQMNKERIYHKKQGGLNAQLQQLQLALGNQQSQDFVQEYPGCNPKQVMRIISAHNKLDHKFKNLNVSKLSQSQKIDFQKIKDASKAVHKEPPQISQSHQRKSCGMEFIEIKKEIQEELKTLEERGIHINPLSQELHDHQYLPSSESQHLISSSDLDLNLFSKLPHHHDAASRLSGQMDGPSRKKLKIKQSNQQNVNQTNLTAMTGSSLLDFSIGHMHPVNKTERKIDDGQPVHKIVVIKKSKIRKFMKMKKKEKQKEQQQQMQSEILKTIKMQENITKLNEFCKKILHKQAVKKRNPVNQQPNQSLSLKNAQEGVDKSMINQTIRQVILDKTKKRHRDQHDDESSRLSTEFYEEYYRLMNSLRKNEQAPVHEDNSETYQEQNSRAAYNHVLASSPTSKSMMQPSNNKTTLVVNTNDDRNTIQAGNNDSVHYGKAKQSKSSLSHNKLAKAHKPKPLKIKGSNGATKKVNHMKEPFHNAFLNFAIMQAQSKAQKAVGKSKKRAESAPLFGKKNKSKIGAQIPSSIQQVQQQQPIPERNDCEQDQIAEQTVTIDEKYEEEEEVGSKNDDFSITQTELDILNIYVNKQAAKIQKAFRRHLLQCGFYDRELPQTESLASTVQRQPEKQSSHVSSQKHVDDSHRYIQSNSHSEHHESGGGPVIAHQQQQQPFEGYVETEEDETVRRQEEQHMRDEGSLEQSQEILHQEDQGSIEQNPYGDEYDEEEEEEDYDIAGHNMIIINEQQSIDDDKKVVYLSNINSCSLPQTPKPDDTRIFSDRVQNQAQVTQFILEQRNPNLETNAKDSLQSSPSQQQLNYGGLIDPQMMISPSDEDGGSQIPSVIQLHNMKQIQGQNSFSQEEDFANFDNESKSSMLMLDASEDKFKDYQMRLITGSESVLREFKMSTPKETKNLGFKGMPFVPQLQNIGAGGQNSKRVLTSHNSQSSLLNPHLQNRAADNETFPLYNQDYFLEPLQLQHQQTSIELKTHTQTSQSQSNQSLFDRNSFQKFTAQQLHNISLNNEFMQMIETREKAVDYRKEQERRYIKKMYKQRQFSPRTYSLKKEQLERWVTLERDEIQKSKKQFQEEWDKTLIMIEETQKNVDIMREQIKSHGDAGQQSKHQSVISNRQVLNGVAGATMDLQSSHYSNDSYPTTSHKNERKSILEQEEYKPLSHRSFKGLRYQVSEKKQQQQPLEVVPENTLSKERTLNNTNHPINQLIAVEKPVVNNLIDFLEDSWKKSQSNAQPPYNYDQKPAINIGGILIEDQHSTRLRSQHNHHHERQDSAQGPFSYNNSEDEYNRLHPGQQNQEDQQQQQQQLESSYEKTQSIVNEEDIILQVQSAPSGHRDDERPLLRSRSEQDLSELLKNTNKQITNEKSIEREQADTPQDSFRVLDDGLQQNPSNSVLNFNFLVKQQNDQIKIQENLFDESSNRQLSSSRDPSFPIRGDQLAINSERQFDDIRSNSHDSLLNEQELENQFRGENPKFSIEDFKQLDKRKLLLREEDSSSEAFEQPSERLESGRLNNIVADAQVEEQLNVVEQASHLLFSDAKPGENIKIQDLLKMNSQAFVRKPVVQENVQVLDQHEESEFKFAMEEIKHHSSAHDLLIMGCDIAESVLLTILMEEIETSKALEIKPSQDLPLTQPSHQMVPHSTNEHQGDVFLVDVTYNEKEQRREVIEFKLRCNIEQDLLRIENYVNEIITMLQQHELNYLEALSGTIPFSSAEPNYHRQFLQVLTNPIKRNQLDVLNQLQTSEIGSYEHFETAMDSNGHPILPVDLYLDIERQREEQHLRLLYSHQGEIADIENSVVQESVHIHNKAIFDALNESLMKFRPYGIQGEPMPWSNKVRRLQTKVDTSQVDTERLFYLVRQDVMRWSQNCVGCLPSQVYILKQNINGQVKDQFDEETFQETREKRLAAMLASEVVETEHQWLNYEFEEAQVKVDLSDMILEHLVEETVLFMNQKMQQQLQ